MKKYSQVAQALRVSQMKAKTRPVTNRPFGRPPPPAKGKKIVVKPTKAAKLPLETPTKLRLAKREPEYDVVLTLTYADDLEHSLQFLWWPLRIAMRVPFKVTRYKKSILVTVDRKSPWFYSACCMTLLLCLVFVWFTIGVGLLYFGEKEPDEEILLDNKTIIQNPMFKVRAIELSLFRRYFASTFIVWSILFHASIASVHLLVTCEDHACLVRDWLKAIDFAKLRVATGLTEYIVHHLLIIGALCLGVFIAYFERTILPGIYGSANVMSMAMFRLFISNEGRVNEWMEGGSPYFEKFSPICLILFIFAIVSARLNLLFFMVMVRVFKVGSELMNQRVSISFRQYTRAEGGANSIHLDYITLYKDHLQISSLGKQLGSVFGPNLVFYYLIQMLCITLELSSLAYFEFQKKGDTKYVRGTSILVSDKPEYVILNAVVSLAVSLSSLVYMTNEASVAGEIAMSAFDIVRRQGLVISKSERERNFVRSMWYSGGAKNPIVIQPSNMFTLNRQFLVDVLGTCFFYFILMWQFKHNANVRQQKISGRPPPTT